MSDYRYGTNSGYEHRGVAAAALGRPLAGREEVHHVNGDKHDNRPCNLVICPDRAYHFLLHARQRIVDMGGVLECTSSADVQYALAKHRSISRD